MWKNFKIGSKLLLGFGLLLSIFIASIVVTEKNMKKVAQASSLLADGAVPAMMLASELEHHVFELFQALRSAENKETESSLAEVSKELDDIQKELEAIDDLHSARPELQTMRYEVEKVVPVYEACKEIIELTLTAIVEKRQAYGAMLKVGENMDSLADNLENSLYSSIKEKAQTLDAGEIQVQLEMLRLSTEIREKTLDLRRTLQMSIVTDDARSMREAFNMTQTLEKRIHDLDFLISQPEQKETMARLSLAAALYGKNLQNFVANFEKLNELDRSRASKVDQFMKESVFASNLGQSRVKEVSMNSAASLDKSIDIMILVTVITLVVGVLIAILISRSITKPLRTIVALAKRAKDGDLTIESQDFRYRGKDELGALAEALSEMIMTQENSMRQIVSIAVDLSHNAGDLSAISEETHASMEEVKASIERVSSLSEENGAALQECNAGVEEMSAGADTVAQSATDSAAFISQTTEASNGAIQMVNNVIAGMRDVDENSKESENKMRMLATSVKNVSSFVSVITGIADQTNLLALNAAIEAARAGDVGRGFAVVAEEVRKLAEESARAAQSVGGIIVDLQDNAQASIKSTTEAGHKLEETLGHAEHTQEELNGALKEMSKANESIQNIAAVAEEQAASSKEVATAIDSATKSTMNMVETLLNIRRASEDTLRVAQGVADQSQTLNQHAQTLTDILAQFKLRTVPAAGKAMKAT